MTAWNPAFCSSGVAMPNVLFATGPTICVRPKASFTVLPPTPVAVPVGQLLVLAACVPEPVAAAPPVMPLGPVDEPVAPEAVGLAPEPATVVTEPDVAPARVAP